MQYKITYRKERALYKREVKAQKKKNWLRYCENTSETYGRIFKIARGKNLKNTDLVHTLLEKSEFFETYDDVLSLLMDDHFKSDVSFNFEIFKNERDVNLSEICISNRELKHAADTIKNNKAPGFDRVDGRTVKNLTKNFRSLIISILNKCFLFSYFPSIWKKAVIIFFRKQNKDPLNSKSYRPISLLPTMGKLFEKLIRNRVMTHLESTNFLDEDQHGFREGKGTNTAIASLLSKLDCLKDNYKYVSFISLDIMGAFDKISWNKLFLTIDETNLPIYLKILLKNYLVKRKVGVKLMSDIKWSQLARGCPQGSCIGPLLWLITADKILKQFKIKSVNNLFSIIAYADDFINLTKGNTRVELEKEAKEKLDNFTDICENMNLTISIEKTKAMMVGKNLLTNRRPLFKLLGKNLKFVNDIGYLGIAIEEKLTFYKHFECVREKITNFTSKYNSYSFYNKGIKKDIVKQWYLTVIDKQITYGQEVWSNRINEHTWRRVSSCQRLGLLSIAKTYRTVSTDALCIITGVLPIKISIKNNTIPYMVFNNNYVISMENEEMNADSFEKELNTYEFSNYNDIKNLIILGNKEDINNQEITIYTDGSKMDSGTASAFVVYENDIEIFTSQYLLNKKNSIYQVELSAIKEAIAWFNDSKYSTALICTDSEASVKVLQKLFNFE